jgi:hypothetical protein
MARMGSYCKAYPAEQLRRFGGWIEKVPPLTIVPRVTQDSNAVPREPETYYYVQEDYTVTAGVFIDENVAFDEVTDAWKDFCTNTLKFEIPNYRSQ